MTRIWVRWIDAQLEPEQMTKEVAEDQHPLYRENIGYLIKAEKDYLNLAFGVILNDDGSIHTYDDVLTIPHCMIEKTKEIEM